MLACPDGDRRFQQPARRLRCQGIERHFQGRGVCHPAVALRVDKFGLDAEFLGFREKVHSAHGLQQANKIRWEKMKQENRIATFNARPYAPFPMEPTHLARLLYMIKPSLFELF